MDLQPPTIFPDTLSRRNPAHRDILKARDAEYQSVWQLIGRTACRDVYVRATVSARRNLLREVVAKLMEKRKKQGRAMAGADINQMIERHLKKEASERARKRKELDGVNIPLRFAAIASNADDTVPDMNIDGDLNQPGADDSSARATKTSPSPPTSGKAPVADMGPDPNLFNNRQPSYGTPSPQLNIDYRYHFPAEAQYPRQNTGYITQTQAIYPSDDIHALEESFAEETNHLRNDVATLQRENVFLYDELRKQAARATDQDRLIATLQRDVAHLIHQVENLTYRKGEAKGEQLPEGVQGQAPALAQNGSSRGAQ